MAIILKKMFDAYHYLDEVADPRTKDQYIVRNPILVFLLLFFYQKFVLDWGPKFMEKRKPFKLEKLMIVYNAGQIAVSAYIFYTSIVLAWSSGYYNLVCQPLIFDDTPIERKINNMVWLYYVVKMVDLLDTVFFVLRKKYNQVTFLHVYHHIGMVLTGFMAVKYVPAAHGTMLGTINSAVHAVMYFYYLLTCLYPVYKNSIWWKKYITQLQMFQFMILIIHFGHVIFRPSCAYPKWISLLFVPQNVFMFVMFADFYYKAYIKKKKTPTS